MFTDRGMHKKKWYTYTMEYYSAIKKAQNNAICSNMDKCRDCHTEWSKSDRKINIKLYHLYMESLKNDTNELIYKQKKSQI